MFRRPARPAPPAPRVPTILPVLPLSHPYCRGASLPQEAERWLAGAPVAELRAFLALANQWPLVGIAATQRAFAVRVLLSREGGQ